MTPDPAAVPDGWQVMRLGDVATLQRGMDLPEDKRIFGRVPVFGSNGVHGFHNASPVQGPGVITGRSGSMGHVYYSESSYWPLNTTLFVKDFHGNDERFVFHLLSNSRLERFAASTGVPSLNRNFVHPLRVALPPLAEQRAIAAVLDAIDEAIERTEEVIAATERLRDALLHELLTRGLPGRHSEWADVPGLGTVPACWDVVRLGDVATVEFSSVDKRTVDGEQAVLLCNYTDVFYNRRIRPDMAFMAATATPDECGKWSLRRGDVLFTKDSETPSEIGIPAHVTQDMPEVLCGYHLGRARPDPEHVSGGYLAESLGSPQMASQLARIANGVTRFGLTLDATRRMHIPLPPLDEQQAIAAALDGVDGAIERAREERAGLHSLQASAADALLTGRVRVADATGEAT